VECTMDRRKGIGALTCRLCGASYQMPINHLDEPIDVFSEWLDDCVAAEKANQNGGAPAMPVDDKFQENDIGDDEGEDEDDDLLDEDQGLRHKHRGNDSSARSGAVTTTDLGLGDSDSEDE